MKLFCVVARKYGSATAGRAGSKVRSVKQWQVMAGIARAAGAVMSRRKTTIG
jgi:hypothetical protein